MKKQISFNKFSKKCKFHIKVDTKVGQRCVCKLAKGRNPNCNTYNCHRWRPYYES